jgi:hypothetical protein
MQKPSLIIALFLLFAGVSVQAQQAVPERNPPVVAPSALFQQHLESLYLAVNAKDNDRIAGCERSLYEVLRQELSVATEQKRPSSKRLNEIFEQFVDFSFANAGKDAADAHLALLEEFLAIISN